MIRDLARLRRLAALVEADLDRGLDGSWRYEIGDDLWITITGPTWTGLAEIDTEVDEDVWDDDPEAYERDPEAALDLDATVAVAELAVELAANALLGWPRCPTDGSPVTADSGRWVCQDGDHDVAPLGSLGA